MSESIEFTIYFEPRQPSWFDTGGEPPGRLVAERNGVPVRAFGMNLTADDAIGLIQSEREPGKLFALFAWLPEDDPT